MTIHDKHISVATFLSQRIDGSGKSQREIAAELGYEHPNIITMFKQGLTKIPLRKVGPLANALEIDPAHFLRLVMREYMPETWGALEEIMNGALLSKNEQEMLACFRRLTGDTDPPAVMIGGIVAILSAAHT